jgi:hypothetical protein
MVSPRKRAETWRIGKPEMMLKAMGQMPLRKARLLYLAVVRLLMTTSELARYADDMFHIEAVADGTAQVSTRQRLLAALAPSAGSNEDRWLPSRILHWSLSPRANASLAIQSVLDYHRDHTIHPYQQADQRVMAVQSGLLRELFGNPFRPVRFDFDCLTGELNRIMALARRAYDYRDFSELPILGDMLEDAGCRDEAVLTHCRQSRPHIRGCWLLDQLLGH